MMNHSKAVYKTLQIQRQGQMLPCVSEAVHEVQQDRMSCTMEQENNDRSIDSVNVKYLNFDNIKSVYIHQA